MFIVKNKNSYLEVLISFVKNSPCFERNLLVHTTHDSTDTMYQYAWLAGLTLSHKVLENNHYRAHRELKSKVLLNKQKL